jgi:hypothetical protein
VFPQYAREAIMQFWRKDHAGQSDVRVARGKERTEFTFGLRERHWSDPAAAHCRTFPARSVDEFAKLLGEFAVPLTSLMCRELRSDREKPILIAGNVALKKRDDVARNTHIIAVQVPRVQTSINIVQLLCTIVSKKGARSPNGLATPQLELYWLG